VCWQLTVKLLQIHCSMVKNSEILSMLADKKYPNCRLYDIEKSKYVTVEDIRRIILKRESITVVDSKTEKDLTRAVLRQAISDQECKGYESTLKSRALEQLVRFYGGGMQSIMTFLEQDAPDLSGTL
jgi:polyhydroxyalkanoate synthesis repressor PhaR